MTFSDIQSQEMLYTIMVSVPKGNKKLHQTIAQFTQQTMYHRMNTTTDQICQSDTYEPYMYSKDYTVFHK